MTYLPPDFEIIPVPQANRDAAVFYDKLLRDMKRKGIKVDDLTEEAARSMLIMHHNALLVWYADKINAGRFTINAERRQDFTWPV